MVKTRTFQVTHSTLTLDDGQELELPYPGDVMEHVVTERDNGTIRVSYMVSDDDGASCYEDDMFHGWDHVILDSQGDADELSQRLGNCHECGADVGESCDPDDDPHDRVNAERQALTDGRAFLFEKYEHGQVCYALQGESSQIDRQWDVTSVAGFMIADNDWGEGVDVREAARCTLAEYTDWCNGSVYGIVHVEYKPGVVERTVDHRGMVTTRCNGCGNIVILFDDDTHECWTSTDEACWGFIGYEYAERTMREEH